MDFHSFGLMVVVRSLLSGWAEEKDFLSQLFFLWEQTLLLVAELFWDFASWLDTHPTTLKCQRSFHSDDYFYLVK